MGKLKSNSLILFVFICSLSCSNSDEDNNAPENSVADFEITLEGEYPPVIIATTNLSSDADSYRWTFGAESGYILDRTSNPTSPTWTYVHPGTYNIILSVELDGETYIKNKEIVIEENPNVYWTKQISGTSEFLNCLYFINENKGFVGGENSTLLKTIDGGETWEDIPIDGDWSILDIHFPSDNVGYVVGKPSLSSADDLILKTTDGGITWEQLPFNNLSYSAPQSVYFLNEQTGFIGSSSDNNYRMLKTDDGGGSWQIVADIEGSFSIRDIIFTNNSIGYALGIGNSSYIFKTINEGTTWQKIYTSPAENIRLLDITLSENEVFSTVSGNNDRIIAGENQLEKAFSNSYIESALVGISFTESSGFGIASSGDFIIFTEDYGERWGQMSLPNDYPESGGAVYIQTLSNSLAYAVGEQGVIMKYAK